MSFINSAKNKVVAPKTTKLNIVEGSFNNLNAEAALLTVEKLGIDRTKALNALGSFVLPEGRMMYMTNNLGITICIDFAHTPDSLKAVLTHLKETTNGDLIVVFGCAGQRDVSKRSKMGVISTDLANYSIFTAEDPRSEDVNDIINQMASKINSSKVQEGSVINFSKTKTARGKHYYFRIPERGEAVLFAVQKLAKAGDTVAVLGKGHEKSMAYGGVEYPWDDRSAVRLALRGKALVLTRK